MYKRRDQSVLDKTDKTMSKRYHWIALFKENWAIYRQNILGRIGLVLLVIFGLMALTSFIPPLIHPMYHPMTGVDPVIVSSTGPSLKHWLGTDFMGRDILSQLLVGARVAFMVGVSAAFMSIFMGTAVGMMIAMVPQLVPVAKEVTAATRKTSAGKASADMLSLSRSGRKRSVLRLSQQFLSDQAEIRIRQGSRHFLMPRAMHLMMLRRGSAREETAHNTARLRLNRAA